MVQFLDPETAKILQFLDPEIVEMDKKNSGSRNRRNGVVSGPRNRRNTAVSGSRNCKNGQKNSGSRNHRNGVISGSINRRKCQQILFLIYTQALRNLWVLRTQNFQKEQNLKWVYSHHQSCNGKLKITKRKRNSPTTQTLYLRPALLMSELLLIFITPPGPGDSIAIACVNRIKATPFTHHYSY